MNLACLHTSNSLVSASRSKVTCMKASKTRSHGELRLICVYVDELAKPCVKQPSLVKHPSLKAKARSSAHLHPCLWPGVCGQLWVCCALCRRCVCFQDCRTSWAFCREEWHLRSRASFHVDGPLLDGSSMNIWEPIDNKWKALEKLNDCNIWL